MFHCYIFKCFLQGIIEHVTGPNRAHRQEEYDISIKQVGNPLNLSLLRSLKELSETKSDDNIKFNDLQSVKQMLSVVLHEHCSSQADFIFNRSYFSQPAVEDRFGNWDLGLGKAIWRGFYSCLMFSKGTHQLLMNLDSKIQRKELIGKYHLYFVRLL
jgi:hypothetical protein